MPKRNDPKKRKKQHNQGPLRGSTIQKNGRPPPIVIYEQNQGSTMDLIKNTLGMSNFLVKKINNNKHNLYTDNVKDFKQAKEQLEVANTKFYSFTPKEEKAKSFLLKGLDNNENVNEVFDELTKHNNDNLKFIKVSRFTKLKSRNENKILPIYLVQLS